MLILTYLCLLSHISSHQKLHYTKSPKNISKTLPLWEIMNFIHNDQILPRKFFKNFKSISQSILFTNQPILTNRFSLSFYLPGTTAKYSASVWYSSRKYFFNSSNLLKPCGTFDTFTEMSALSPISYHFILGICLVSLVGELYKIKNKINRDRKLIVKEMSWSTQNHKITN